MASNESLIQALHDAATELSYYNAGEGPSYYRETQDRLKASSRWSSLVIEAKQRGIYNPEDFRNYLV